MLDPDWSTARCVQNNGLFNFSDPVDPMPGEGFWYVSRDVLDGVDYEPVPPGSYVGTYNNTCAPTQVGNRDLALAMTCP